MAIAYKSRFRKWFVKELIKAYHQADDEGDVIVITFDEKYNEKGDLAVLHKTAKIQVRPFEELWVKKNKDRVEHLFLKDPVENKTGN